MYTYRQASGCLLHDDLTICVGYSGSGIGKNNPGQQATHNVGPIPAGEYTIGTAHYDHEKGSWVMALAPKEGTETFGRSGFLMHGDSLAHPGEASHGCIILPHDIREMIANGVDKDLTVTA